MSNGIHARFQIPYPDFSLDIDLALPSDGVTALFGPSGSGKTTFLRAMAGLEKARGGYIQVNGEIWQDDAKSIFLSTHQRSLGYVFQEASLFPHLTVQRNLEYGLNRLPSADRRVRFQETVELLGIERLLERQPAKLSGGERQRVAIARALLSSPRILLFDEPLAALDLARKQEILPYLERLHDELDIPMIYVSHAPDEVARLADHLVILADGKALASGPLSETLARLDLPTVWADYAGVVIEGEVVEHDLQYHLTRLRFSGGELLVGYRNMAIGATLRVHVLARDVSITLHEPSNTSILNRLPATVTSEVESETPGHVMLKLDSNGTPLLARITRRSRDLLRLSPGQQIWAQIKAVALLG